MNRQLKKLLIECHPDRHGGDHSQMEKFYREKAKTSLTGKRFNPNHCAICGVAVAGNSKHCGIHWRLVRRAILI